MLIFEVAYFSYNAFYTVEAFTFLWSRPTKRNDRRRYGRRIFLQVNSMSGRSKVILQSGENREVMITVDE